MPCLKKKKKDSIFIFGKSNLGPWLLAVDKIKMNKIKLILECSIIFFLMGVVFKKNTNKHKYIAIHSYKTWKLWTHPKGMYLTSSWGKSRQDWMARIVPQSAIRILSSVTFLPTDANYQSNLLGPLALCSFIVSSQAKTSLNTGSILSQIHSTEGHHGRMAGYCLSNSKWIAGSLRQYPFHYNAGLCYNPFQTSNCPVLRTFIDMHYFKWKHNTEVRESFWDSRDPRWSQRGKLL